MTLYEKLKEGVKDAMRAKDAVKLDVLRVAIGEIETNSSRTGKPATDEEVEKVLRKQQQGIKESIDAAKSQARSASIRRDHPFNRWNAELAVLDVYVLPEAGERDVMAFLTANSMAALMEAKSDGQATGIAMKAMKAANIPVNGRIVGDVVKEIRASGIQPVA